MNNKTKIIIVVFFILSFLVFLHYRRKRLQENFECVKIDNSLFCPEAKNDIDKFRLDQDEYYKVEVVDRDFYRYLKNFTGSDKNVGGGYKFNYKNSTINDEKLLMFNEYRLLGDVRFNTVFRMMVPEPGINEFYHKYDFIDCKNSEFFTDDFIGGKQNPKKLKIMTQVAFYLINIQTI